MEQLNELINKIEDYKRYINEKPDCKPVEETKKEIEKLISDLCYDLDFVMN